MTIKGRLRELSSRKNVAIATLHHGKTVEIEYRGNMEEIAKKPRSWSIRAITLFGASEFNAEKAMDGRWLHDTNYNVGKCVLRAAVADVIKSIRNDMGSSKPTHSIQLTIHVDV